MSEFVPGGRWQDEQPAEHRRPQRRPPGRPRHQRRLFRGSRPGRLPCKRRQYVTTHGPSQGADPPALAPAG